MLKRGGAGIVNDVARSDWAILVWVLCLKWALNLVQCRGLQTPDEQCVAVSSGR